MPRAVSTIARKSISRVVKPRIKAEIETMPARTPANVMTTFTISICATLRWSDSSTVTMLATLIERTIVRIIPRSAAADSKDIVIVTMTRGSPLPTDQPTNDNVVYNTAATSRLHNVPRWTDPL